MDGLRMEAEPVILTSGYHAHVEPHRAGRGQPHATSRPSTPGRAARSVSSWNLLPLGRLIDAVYR